MERVVVFRALTDMVTVGSLVPVWRERRDSAGKRESQADRASLIPRVLFIRVGEGPCRGVIGCRPRERGGERRVGVAGAAVGRRWGGRVMDRNCLMQDIYRAQSGLDEEQQLENKHSASF